MATPFIKLAATALIGAAVVAPTAAQAQYDRGGYGYARGYDAPPPSDYARGDYVNQGYDQRGGYDRGGYGRNGYDRGGYDRGGYGYAPQGYVEPGYAQPVRYRGRHDGRCDRGTGGTIIGAIAGGLLGNAAAGRGDRGAGTIIGAGLGALAGRAVDRNC